MNFGAIGSMSEEKTVCEEDNRPILAPKVSKEA